ncbi:hypothetical protein D9M70_571690 [compost metagenome]
MDYLREKEVFVTTSGKESLNLFFPRKAVPGEAKIPPSKLREMIRENVPGEPWVGTGAEDWAAAISYFVLEKLKKAGKPGFHRHDQNWLLIYDNWDEPARRRDLADQALKQTLDAMDTFGTFDRVLVLDGHELASFTVAGNQRWTLPRYK